ncbi:unnamed protein product [Allacma fusca]|uniref:Neuroglian n=1 Tax=Allacma fusca TaxID=39272 RepID=A0A8J2L265_9HEXA|nr:unnamed protein product [Allacma fusca]
MEQVSAARVSSSDRRSLLRRTQLFSSYLVPVLYLLIHSQPAAGLVQSPPFMVKQPPTTEVLFQVAQRQDENDKPFLIECEAEGDPQPKYSWVKNGKEFNWQAYDDRISQQPGRGTLVITAPRDEDIGQYQCYAKNEFGTATSNSVFVRKAELNSFKDEETMPITADEGKPLKLPCSPPDGWPKPRVYWIQQNLQGALKSINSSRITVDPEGHLWFSNVTRNDRSQDFYYACAAFSPFRNEYKLGNRVFLNVAPISSSQNKHAPEIQYTTKRSTVALKGEDVDLWCIIGGTPLPEIKWARKGGQLPTDRVQYENYGKTLRIQDVDISDEGSYDCDATNGVGTPISHSVTLSVYAVPYFTVEPEIQNAAEGETVEFHCEAFGKPSPDIKWIHNGVPLEQAPLNPRRELVEGKIIIRDLKKEDTGNYGCNATNSFGYVYKDVYVNVLALPAEITEPPTDHASVDGKTVILRCRVFGAPKPLVRWIREQQELTGGRYRIMDYGDLEISSVTFVDAGSYTCYAENKFGSDNRTGSLVVKEHTRIQDRPEDYEVAAENTAIFRCSAVADSTLTLSIDWLRDNTTIDFETEQRYVKLQDNSLTIDKASELDSGVYTCLARTELDNASAEATLVVQDKPNAPELTGITCNARDATLSWRAMGDNRSPILYYTIQYNTSFTPDSWEVAYKDVPATESSYTVSVSPWANYTFRVIARNKIGPSKPSSHSDVCSTPPDVPFMNPDNVKGHGNRPDNLVISWTPMPEIQHNAPKFRYIVQWKLNDGTERWNREEIKDWRRSDLTVPNQPTYRPYLIRVRAINERGESNVAPTEVQGYSGQDKPLQAPENFTLLSVVDYKTVVVSWNPVPPESLRGKFEGYKVEHWTDDDDVEEVLFKNDATQAAVEDLVPFAKNYLRVRVYNTDHDGPVSRTVEVVMEEGVPGPVELFEAFPLGQSAFYLSWKKPEKPNGILKGYEIYYQKVQGTELGQRMRRTPAIDNPDQTLAKLAGLEAGTKYRIHIHAKTGKGQGEGYFIEERTYDTVAATLAKPRFSWSQQRTENGISTIRVNWKPNLEGQGRPGSHFYVQYKRYGETTYKSTDPELYDDFQDVRGLEPGETYVFRVVAVDGKVEQVSEPEEIYTHPLDFPIIVPPSDTTGWFIGLIVALAFLILILILVCIVKRNRGGKYAVYEREIAHGRLDYDEGGFREYSQPTDERSGRISMASDFRPPHESDTDSMVEYGDDGSKFTEDGSFIGQYGVKKKPDPNLPSPMATFASKDRIFHLLILNAAIPGKNMNPARFFLLNCEYQ